MSENLTQWFDVPADSTIEISVEGDTEDDVDFVSHARCVPNHGQEEFWWDFELHPGPKIKLTADDTSYAIRVAVKFFGEDDQIAVIRAQIFAPDGTVIADWFGDDEYEFEVSGRAGEPLKRATLIVVQD